MEQAVGAPDPRTLLELLVPFFFGRPDLQQNWGKARYFGGMEPLYYSLAPGMLALALLVVAYRHPKTGHPKTGHPKTGHPETGHAETGREGSRREPFERALWALFAAGGLVVYSSGAAGWVVAHVPGGELFRYPMKLALWSALAGSLLAGLGFERLRQHADTRRTLLAAFGALALALAALGALLSLPAARASAFRALFAQGVDAPAYDYLRQGWSRTIVVELVLVGAFVAIALVHRRRPLALAALAPLHVASQLVLLAPLLATTNAEPLIAPPVLSAKIPREAVLAHGAAFRLFGSEAEAGENGGMPLRDPRFAAAIERAHRSLEPFAGLAEGRRYELAVSPEGLDSYLVDALAVAFWRLSDVHRLRVLRATGIDILISTRPLGPEAEPLVERVERFETPEPVHVYTLSGGLEEVQLLGSVRYAPEIGAALRTIAAGEVDAATTAVLAGGDENRDGPRGRAALIHDATESIGIEAESEAGGALVVRRAWLPHWRVSVDGRPAKTVVANLTRLAVELPPGRHAVRFWIDRTPFRWALALSALGVLGLVLLARGVLDRRFGWPLRAGPRDRPADSG